MLYIGIDLHKRYSQLTVADKQGEILDRAKLANDKELISKYVDSFAGDKKAAVEATGNWYWLVDLLEEKGIKTILSHPVKTRAIADAKIKTDKLDSQTLTHLLRAGLLPACYVPQAELREYRERLRYRAALVKVRTSLKNRVHALLAKNNIKHSFSDLFGKGGRKFLDQLTLTDAQQQSLKSDLRLLDTLNDEIGAITAEIAALSEENPTATLLKSVPGIGPQLSLLIMAEIGDIARFQNAKKLCSYAGLVPSTHSSGGRTYHGHITRQGSSWLRWAMIEAAMKAVMRPGPLRDLYRRLSRTKGNKIARVAVARKMLSYIYHMLRQNKSFEQVLKDIQRRRVSPSFAMA